MRNLTPTQQAQRSKEFRSYFIGIAAAFVLTIIPFGLVIMAGLGRNFVLWIVGLLALAQIIVHFRYFLHVDLSLQKREDLHLILFSALLLILMIGGTLWIMFNLHSRML